MRTRGTLRRQLPSPITLLERKEYLSRLRESVQPSPSVRGCQGLEPGNKKTGLSGNLYKSIFVWNLPAAATCPGASPWCLTCCYNADTRVDVFPISRWMQNWSAVEERPTEVETTICSQLQVAPQPAAVRIHSSGDFYSSDYVALWLRICARNPDVHFWSYTRSWANPNIRTALEELRKQPNVQIFASWDASMPSAPPEWRQSVVRSEPASDEQQSESVALNCPEEISGGPTCASCGYCIRKGEGDVIFTVH